MDVSRWTVRRELHRLGYMNVLPGGTPILTNEQKERRVHQWALRYQNDDWSRTIFTDETSYQLLIARQTNSSIIFCIFISQKTKQKCTYSDLSH